MTNNDTEQVGAMEAEAGAAGAAAGTASPAAGAADVAGAKPSSKATGAGTANQASKPLVLVVEDDGAIRNLVSTALDLNDYRYESVGSGKAAIMEAVSHNPDLILLDLGLPDIDGVEVIRKVRTWSNVPIIVISARTEETDKIGALDAGADDYLTKPFSVDELFARVRATLRRTQMAGADDQNGSVFENGPLRIDFAAGVVYRDGEELHLTPTEYKLLTLMARNVGRVLTHTYITHQIWGTSWEGDVASLRVYMATLRKKIEPDPTNPQLIQTHIGVGYRMPQLH